MSQRNSGYPPALLVLVLSTVLMVSGFSMMWPLVTLYVHSRLGLPMSWAGVVLLVQSAANLGGNLVGGPLFDTWGGRRTVLVGACSASLAAFGMALTHGLYPYLAMTVVLGFGTGLIYPSINAFAAQVWPDGQRAAFNAVYVASNVGVAVGSMAGGLLAEIRFSLSFTVTGIVMLVYACVVLLGMRAPAFGPARATPRQVLPDGPAAPRGPAGLWRLAPWLLALGLFLDWTAYVQWQTTVAVHMEVLGFALSRYSLLWTVNGVLILAGQPLVAWFTRQVPAVKLQMLLGNVLFILSFVLLLRARAYSAFLGGMALTTLGEMFVWPGVPAAADRLAPEGRRGLYQGLVSGAASTGRAAGPLFGGLLYDRFPTQVLFLVMIAVFIVGLAVLAVYDRFPPRTVRREAAVPPGY